MTTPRVSVLMPVYNEERYVGKAIESILHQTFTDFELIVVDDGSTDSTPGILSDYARRDTRVVLLGNGTNQGLVPTLNHGLAAARGEYVARADANDVSLPGRLAHQVSFMDQHPAVGVLGTNMAYIDAEGRFLYGGRPKDRYSLCPALIRWMLLWRCAIYHTTVMIRKILLERTGFAYDSAYRHAEDRDLWARLAPHTAVASLPEVLVHCRLLATGVSRDFNKEQRAKSHAITRRELTKLLGAAPSEKTIETLISVFTRHNLGAHHDFVGAADLLFQAYQRFREQSLSRTDQRQIEKDVALRLLVIGQEAALHSPRAAFQVLWRLRHLSPGLLVSIKTTRGVIGVFLKTIGLRRPERPDSSPLITGGNSD